MTKFFADLKLPFSTDMEVHVRRDCNKQVLGHFDFDERLFDPRITEFLNQANVSPAHFEVFYTPPRHLLPIHVDGPRLSNMVKLNWCYGGSSSRMMWWKLKSGVDASIRQTVIGTPYLTIPQDRAVMVSSKVIGQPTLVNVGVPHSVINSGPDERWVLSVVLADARTGVQLQWDEAETLLGPWLQ